MGQEHMVDQAHLIQAQIPNAGAGIDQYVGIEQEGRRATVLCNGAGTAEHAQFHPVPSVK